MHTVVYLVDVERITALIALQTTFYNVCVGVVGWGSKSTKEGGRRKVRREKRKKECTNGMWRGKGGKRTRDRGEIREGTRVL